MGFIKRTAARLVNTTYYGIWILSLVMLLAIFSTFITRYNTLMGELNQLQAELAREQMDYSAMRTQAEYLETDAYIEMLARERLGLVFPNDLVFLNIAE